MHCKPGSPLDSQCDVGIHIPLLREICPWNLAPVSSSAVQMLYCDTVSAAIMKVKRKEVTVNLRARSTSFDESIVY